MKQHTQLRQMSDRKLWSRAEYQLRSIMDSVDKVDPKHLVLAKLANLDRSLKELHSRDQSTQLYLWSPDGLQDPLLDCPTAYTEA